MPRTTSANMVPSEKIPNPLNIRRGTTGPNAANISTMLAASMAARGGVSVRLGRFARRRRQRHRLAAAAGGGLVRIVEHEAGGELVDLEVHLGAEQEHHRLGIDQQLDALVLDHLVVRRDAVG